MSMSLSVIDAYEVTDITRQFLINWKVGVPLCRVASLQVFLLAHVDIFKASYELSHQHLLSSHLHFFLFSHGYYACATYYYDLSMINVVIADCARAARKHTAAAK